MTHTITLIIAALSCVGTVIAVVAAARSGNRRINKYDRLAILFAVITFSLSSWIIYSTYQSKRIDEALPIAWENRLDQPIDAMHLGFLIPRGVAFEGQIANKFSQSTLSIKMNDGAESEFFIKPTIDGHPRVICRQSNLQQDAGCLDVFGRSIQSNGKFFGWWCKQWEAPPKKAVRLKYNGTKKSERVLQDRLTSHLRFDIQEDFMPVKRLRDLPQIQEISFKHKYVKGDILFRGESDVIVYLTLKTGGNKFDICPAQHAIPASSKEERVTTHTATGVGTLNRLRHHYIHSKGISSREVIGAKQGVLDYLTSTSAAVRVLGVVTFVPSVPQGIEESPAFVKRFGEGAELYRISTWQGFIGHDEIREHAMVVVARK